MDLSHADTLMVIKSTLGLLIFLLSLQVLGATKESTWLRFQRLGEDILAEKKTGPRLNERLQEFRSIKKELEDREYQENETYNLSTRVEAYVKDLKEDVLQKQYELGLSYLSFQKEMDFKNNLGKSKLILTSNVLCAGGSYGVANEKYHYWLDACAFYGKTNVGNESNTTTFQQDNIDTYGLKLSPAFGIFTSSNKSEVGFKTPLLYSHQTLSRPTGTTLREGSDFQLLGSFYFRFPVKKLFFQMELGKFLSQDVTLWSLGTGYRF